MFPGEEKRLLQATEHSTEGSGLSKQEYFYFGTSNLVVLFLFIFPLYFKKKI